MVGKAVDERREPFGVERLDGVEEHEGHLLVDLVDEVAGQGEHQADQPAFALREMVDRIDVDGSCSVNRMT